MPKAKPKVKVSEDERREIEQAIARGWSLLRIVTQLGVTEAQYQQVLADMEKACRS